MTRMTDADRTTLIAGFWGWKATPDASRLADVITPAVETIVARAVNEALTEAADELDAKVPARRKHHFAEVEAMDNTFKRAARIVRARAT